MNFTSMPRTLLVVKKWFKACLPNISPFSGFIFSKMARHGFSKRILMAASFSNISSFSKKSPFICSSFNLGDSLSATEIPERSHHNIIIH